LVGRAGKKSLGGYKKDRSENTRQYPKTQRARKVPEKKCGLGLLRIEAALPTGNQNPRARREIGGTNLDERGKLWHD